MIVLDFINSIFILWACLIWVVLPTLLIIVSVQKRHQKVSGICAILLSGYLATIFIYFASEGARFGQIMILALGPIILPLYTLTLFHGFSNLLFGFAVICSITFIGSVIAFWNVGFNALSVSIWSLVTMLLSFVAVEAYVQYSMQSSALKQFSNTKFERKSAYTIFNNAARETGASWHGYTFYKNKHYHWSFKKMRWEKTCPNESCLYDEKV